MSAYKDHALAAASVAAKFAFTQFVLLSDLPTFILPRDRNLGVHFLQTNFVLQVSSCFDYLAIHTFTL